MKGDVCRSKLVCGEIKRAKNKDEQRGPDDVLAPMPPSKGLKMLVSTIMTGHETTTATTRMGRIEMAKWDLSRKHFCGDARRWVYTYLPEGHGQKGKLARHC